MANFIFEIGFEELPASFIVPAANQLQDFFVTELSNERLGGGICKVFSTCSRIGIVFTNLPDKQPDLKELVTGAPKKVALNPDGTLSKAGNSFLSKNGLSDYFFENSEKGEVIAGWKEEKGKNLEEVLFNLAKRSIGSLSFKKNMRWGEHKFYFARPIRWIFLSINGVPIEGEFEGIPFSKTTFGHRFLANGQLSVTAENYEEVLQGHYVVADREKRKKMIKESILLAAKNLELTVNIDEFLLEEVTDMLEYPHVVTGSIPEKQSHLPVELTTKVLRKDQRYFVLHEKGKREKVVKFASVLNNIPVDDAVVVRGNEKVVSARLADAEFYFSDDLSRDFYSLKEKLSGVLFQKELGSYSDKVKRIGEIAKFAGEKFFNLDADYMKKVMKAAEMVKNDLVTGVVFEFPDLQGIMGKYYALAAGFDEETAGAMFEHYLPVNAGDSLPSTVTGTLLSIADKVDTITGGFMAGMKPTGSKDKFSIRRNAISLLTVAVNNEKNMVNLRELFEFSIGLINRQNEKLKGDIEEIFEFIVARYSAVLNFDTPVIQASTASEAEIPVIVKKRAETIDKLLKNKEILELAQLYKRGCNILKKEENMDEEPDETLFEQAEESNLYALVKQVEHKIKGITDNLEIALEIITIKPVLDSFFDAVFVMADNPKIRTNRMRLINKVTSLVYKNIGDISYLNI
ncbi:MAG: glycine--tRNA ligase subunit beta [bacterium]